MIEQKRIFFLGIFIFLIPFLGIPTFWKTVLITLSGFILMAMSVKVTLPIRIRNKYANKTVGQVVGKITDTIINDVTESHIIKSPVRSRINKVKTPPVMANTFSTYPDDKNKEIKY